MIAIQNFENVIYISKKDEQYNDGNRYGLIISDELLDNKQELKNLIVKVITNNTYKIVICNEEIAMPVLLAISGIDQITAVKLKYDKALTKSLVQLIVSNNNINLVSCYDYTKNIKDMFKDTAISLKNYRTVNDNFEPNNINIKRADIKTLRYFRNVLDENIPVHNIYLHDANGKVLRQIIDILKYKQVYNITIFIIKFTSNSYRYNKNIVQEARHYLQKVLPGHNITIDNYYINNRKSNDLIFKIVIMFVSSLVTAILLAFIFYYQDAMSKYDQKNLQDIYEDEELVESDLSQDELETEYDKNNEMKARLKQRFEELLKINNDTVGWLSVNNTGIDYPIVQSNDNEYYLDRNFYQEQSIYGWPFLDYRNNPSILDDNNIIYGHYSQSDTMFGALKNTLKESWYTNPENQIITFNTVNSPHKWQIFSLYTVPVTNDYLYYNFSSAQSFDNFVNTITSRSIYNFGVEVNYGDKILTLSTCYKTSSYRLVIHAKLIS